jgi:hypothetical protein
MTQCKIIYSITRRTARSKKSAPRLGSGDGTMLAPLDLPQDFWILLVLPKGAHKESTASVYAAFD